MPKPNINSTVNQMKQYIREKKINHPDVRLGMRKAEMIKGLKKAGHWDASVKKTFSKGQLKKIDARIKKSSKRLVSRKNLSKEQKDFLADIKE